MLIPPSSSAAQAASVASQATAKETSAEASPAGGPEAKQAAVEKSNSASADRDAQGQGDGLPGERRPAIVDELDVDSSKIAEEPAAVQSAAAPVLPDELPSQLDIVG
jgi:hypothetical protein